MNRAFVLALAAAALGAVVAAPARGQTFAGQSSRLTDVIRLDAGPLAFNINHLGEGKFVVRLLDESRRPIQVLVDAVGAFSGTQSVDIPAPGLYRFAVTADEDWSIQVAGTGWGPGAAHDADTFLEGRLAGEQAAGWSWSWFRRGLLGGTVAGPIGTAVAVIGAGRSQPDLITPDGADPRFAEGYREGLAERTVARRREAAMAGGLVGTGVFLYALVRLLDLDFGGFLGDPPPPVHPT